MSSRQKIIDFQVIASASKGACIGVPRRFGLNENNNTPEQHLSILIMKKITQGYELYGPVKVVGYGNYDDYHLIQTVVKYSTHINV